MEKFELALILGGYATGLLAAGLWFLSSIERPPRLTDEGNSGLETFLDKVGRLNKWAAGITAASVLLSAASTLLIVLLG